MVDFNKELVANYTGLDGVVRVPQDVFNRNPGFWMRLASSELTVIAYKPDGNVYASFGILKVPEEDD